jgi:hypothetical protein
MTADGHVTESPDITVKVVNLGVFFSMRVGDMLAILTRNIVRGAVRGSGDYKDAVTAGIIDPTKVVRVALQDAQCPHDELLCGKHLRTMQADGPAGQSRMCRPSSRLLK